MGRRQLDLAWKRSQALGRHVPIPELRRMLRSSTPQRRLLALVVMRYQLERARGSISYLKLARSVLEDPLSDCRWQALVVIGHFISTNPDAVWRVVLRHGAAATADLRTGVATVLLEHLLEYDAGTFVPKVESELIRQPRAFADMVARCWAFRGAEGRGLVSRLIERARAAATAA